MLEMRISKFCGVIYDQHCVVMELLNLKMKPRLQFLRDAFLSFILKLKMNIPILIHLEDTFKIPLGGRTKEALLSWPDL